MRVLLVTFLVKTFKELKKDKKLNSIVNDLDSSLSKIKKEVERMKKNGEPIPPSYERLLKFKANIINEK